AANGAGRLVFVGGEAGVGKTALVNALIDDLGAKLDVRRGSCDNVTTAAALGPVVDALPEVGDLIDADVYPQRLRLFRRIAALLTAQPTLLLLEDVNWADDATLDLLRFFGRRLAGAPLLVVATFRADEVAAGHRLTTVLGDLASSAGVSRIVLEPLTAYGVAQLLTAASSALDAAALHRRTGGNPFYVTEVVAADEQQLPATIRDAVLARAARLSPAARQVLAAAAVLGRRTDVSLLVAVSGQSATAVDECVRHGMLVGQQDAWAFRHELARLTIEQSLPPAAALELHAAALKSLSAAGIRDDRRLAYHAAHSEDDTAVSVHAPRAAGQAARLGAHREAAEHYRVAARRHHGGDDERAALFRALSYECYLTGQGDEALAARHAAMELCERANDLAGVGDAQRWLSRLCWFLGRNADSIRYATQAVATLEPLGLSHELAMAYSNCAQLYMLGGDTARAINWGERAIGLAREIGDADTEIHALNNVGTAMSLSDEHLEGHRRLAQSLDLALAADAHEHAARAYTNLGASACARWQLADADRYLRAGIAYCTDRDLDSWTLYMGAWLSRTLVEQGRYREAEEGAANVLRHPRLAPITRVHALVVAGQLAARRGENTVPTLDAALDAARPTEEPQRLTPVAAARAEVAWLADRFDDIVTEIDVAWALAVEQPMSWEIGELAWWLALAGDRRPAPVPLPEPFALMAAGAWQPAAQAWRQLGAPLWAARALARSPDLADAREALTIVDELGIPLVREAMLRDRVRLGLPVPRGPRPATQARAFGLTARELEVLRLLADGLTNAEVGARLFLSEKTVGHHVSAVLRKVGEPSRGRAVIAARRQGVL
ncbi:MAG TPA: AAA family ATPase, partial [Jatrophihabitans sp.]|nr:AAA family ATPase [Jatrophihabitans sp.]